MIHVDPHAVETPLLRLPNQEAERKELAVAGELIDKTLSLLRFPAGLERQFWHDKAARRLRYLVISGWLSLLVFNGFLLVDRLLVPDVIGVAIKLRLFVITLPAVLLILLGTYGRSWVLANLSPWFVERVIAGTGVGVAACLAYIQSRSHSPLSQYYHMGLLVVVMYGNLLQRLRFWHAVAFSLTLLVIHIGSVLLVPAFNSRLIVPMMCSLLATIAFTLMANYANERDERRQYLLSLRRKNVLSDLSDVQKRLQHLSRVDALTGVYNRRHFDEYMAQVWQRAQHDGQNLAVIMVDVDHFKLYNDHYGHPAGDVCLSRIGKAMQDSLRHPGDLVARLGGEEFVAVLPQANADVAHMAAERLRLAVRDLNIPHDASSTAPIVTVSVGVACCAVLPGQQAPSLVAAADAALYQAKRDGRDRVAPRTPLHDVHSA